MASGNANVTISTSATSNGTWSALTSGTYTFTPSANNANILNSEIQNRITGTGFTAGNVTILTACSGTGTQSGDVTISAAITAAGSAKTFRITAAGTITVNSAINLTASVSTTAGTTGGSINFSGTTGVSIGAALTTAGTTTSTSGSNANGGSAGSITLSSSSGAVSVTSTLTAQGAAGGTGGSASGGAGGALTISGTSVSISAGGTISTVGGSGPGYNGGAGGAVSITSTSSFIVVSSSITSSGGNAGSANIIGYRGGNAGAVTFTAYTTLTTSNITANGGTNGGYYYHCGGSGATVTLRGTSVSNGSISTSAGTSGGGASGCGTNGSTVNCTRGNVGSQSSSAAVTKNIAITPITHSTTLVTAVGTASGLPPGLSASYSSNRITISGTPTSGGTYNYSWTPTTSSSCGATSISGTILVHETLPVEFVSFDAELIDDYVELIWQTASEINNEKFILEKSFDGENWFAIAEVQGAGNSNSILNYSFTDNSLIKELQYYRLTQVDFDGTQDKSKIVQVLKASDRTVDLQVYPNPMNDEVTVSFSSSKLGKCFFSIYSEIGQELYRSQLFSKEGENSFIFDTAHYAEGIYFFKIEIDNEIIAHTKVVK